MEMDGMEFQTLTSEMFSNTNGKKAYISKKEDLDAILDKDEDQFKKLFDTYSKSGIVMSEKSGLPPLSKAIISGWPANGGGMLPYQQYPYQNPNQIGDLPYPGIIDPFAQPGTGPMGPMGPQGPMGPTGMYERPPSHYIKEELALASLALSEDFGCSIQLDLSVNHNGEETKVGVICSIDYKKKTLIEVCQPSRMFDNELVEKLARKVRTQMICSGLSSIIRQLYNFDDASL